MHGVLGEMCSKARRGIYKTSLNRRTVFTDHVGCVKSFRASVRYLTAAGMSSKPRLLAANFVSLYSRQSLLSWQLKGLKAVQH